MFRVLTIPCLVFIDGDTGKIYTKKGRAKVIDDNDAVDFPWTESDSGNMGTKTAVISSIIVIVCILGRWFGYI